MNRRRILISMTVASVLILGLSACSSPRAVDPGRKGFLDRLGELEQGGGATALVRTTNSRTKNGSLA
jgi:hypothetical protein